MTEEKNENLITRPPVVVVLGHVDHGKSSILEAIKDLKIRAKEAGGITQHIGAYEIEHQGKKITFIDTPGHEAFSAIRSRGAKTADIAVLVVAGEEGVKPQTKEAILHIKKTEIPMLVAINKIDKPEADPEKVKRELAEENILVESMGGGVPSVNVSAKTGQGIPELLEIILLLAEMEDLKTNISKPAEGVVIESYLDAKRGPTATLLLRNGVLKKGEVVGTSSAAGRIRILEDFQGNPVEKVLPSAPAVVVGFEQTPGVGEKFKVFKSIEEAEKIRQELKKKENEPALEDAFSSSGSFGKEETLKLILKADVLGSLEAIEKILKEISLSFKKQSENGPKGPTLKILKAEVGAVNESDVKLALTTGAKIIGFRTKINPIAEKLAQREKITIINFEIIYELSQAVRHLLEKKVVSEAVRVDLGQLKVLAIFRTEKNKNRQIVGGKVIEGEIKQGAWLEIWRGEEKIGKGRIIELQRDKKKVKEAVKGSECGLLCEGEAKIEEGDILKIYVKEIKKREL
jgi:translation initiation factor IF-2